MIPFEEAKARALQAMRVGRLERVGLHESHGRFLADAVFARRASPALDLSAMDGFAVIARDVAGARASAPRRLKVVGEVFAGQPPPKHDLQTGMTMRIYTGAALPYGADAVVREESTLPGESSVAVLVDAKPGDNVRARGEEWREGDRLLEPGTRVDAGVLAVLASMGLVTVPVRAAPKVSIITQGDELVEAGARVEPHQVYDSNRVMLAAMAADAGAHLIGDERVRDDDRALADALERLSTEADLIVTCGGASVGARDRVKWVLDTLGAETIFDGVAMRPGKPVGLYSLGPKMVAVLPGNPLAAAVTFDQLVRPLLFKHQGVLEARRVLTVLFDRDVTKPSGMRQFIPKSERGRVGQSLPLVGALGWLVLPDAPSHVSAGREVPFEQFADPRHLPTSDEPATSG